MTDLTVAALTRLEHLATLVVSGPDAKAFLQGQLSFDMDRLTAERVELACCSSAQGRVQAITWLVQRSDEIVMLLPTSMVEATLARLRKYVLRAKVKIERGDAHHRVFAVSGTALGADRTHVEQDERSFIQWPGIEPRVLAIAPAASDTPTTFDCSTRWRGADIAAGLPQVYRQTHEAFVAQMLNLDLLEGVSFEKGCYTGQEIIARMHFRGTVKRRMFRFRAASVPPEPATRIVVGEQHAGDVVDAVATDDGCELLAVVNLAQVNEPLALGAAGGAPLQRLDLPYPV
jgi:tRNA-modifying protein YgfZ